MAATTRSTTRPLRCGIRTETGTCNPISLLEFAQVLDQTDYLAECDDDGSGELEESAVAEGGFATCDTDGNGVIESEENTDWFEKRKAE